MYFLLFDETGVLYQSKIADLPDEVFNDSRSLRAMSTIIFDDLIFRKHQSGGVAALYRELISRVPESEKQIVRTALPVDLQRFLRVSTPSLPDAVFHSTYYCLPSRNFRGKVVTTIHDFSHKYFPDGRKSLIKDFLISRAISRSDGIICVSDSTRADLLRFCPEVNRKKIVTVPNGVSESFFPLNLHRDTEQVIFVGWRAKYKNFDLVVKALARRRSIFLTLIGGGELDKAEVELLEENLRFRYCHKGYVSQDMLNLEYNRSIALVYPSSYEGFGIPILEAMRSGCPVITGDNSSLREVSGGHAIHLRDISENAIVEAIDRAADPVRRSCLIKDGLLHSQNYSWDKTAKLTRNFYRNILD